MSIDLEKNRNAILKAFNDVVNDKTKTDWALFGYEGQSNVLKLVGTGEDGIEEMAEDLNSSKIMYATLRVLDPNTTRPKIVLINWQGEGAPTLRKGTCARHLTDVNKFLRGVHVTVNARTEEEVEPEVIMSAVLKASATTYNFNERSEISDKTAPVLKSSGPAVTCGDGSKTYPSKKPKPKIKFDVGTNYKRTNPLAEINTKSRNQFWEEQEAEERKRKIEEQSRRNEELKQLETERKQREINEAKHREVLTKERNARISAERKAEEDAAKRLAAQDDKKWQADLQTQYVEEQERAKRAEMMRLERKKEAESLIGHRTHNTRAIFESGNTTSQQTTETNRPPPRKLKEFKPANHNERVENNENAPVLPTRGVTARWPPANTTAQKEATSPNQNKDKVIASSTNIINTSAVPAKQLPHLPEQHILQQTVIQQQVPQPQLTQPQPQITQPQITQSQITQPQITQVQLAQTQITQPQVTQPQVTQPQIPQPQIPVIQQPVHGVVQPQAVQPQAIQHQAVQPVPETVQSIQPQSFDRQSSQPQSNGDISSDIYDTTVVPNKTSNETDYQVYENNEELYDATICATDDHLQTNSTTPAIGMVYEVDGMEYQILPEHGLCARALYDYQAADDTEITFDPEEIITNIDQIDAGWWQGVGPDGTFGLFPANYVELINQSSI